MQPARGRMAGRAGVAILLFATALVARLPFLFASVMDWDESTFILVGQSWADGHLPFTELWDLKGPLLFAPYALTIELFGRSIVAIRLMGVLLVFLTGYATFHLVVRLLGAPAALFGASFTILAITIAPGGQTVMSEIVAILPLTLAALALSEGSRGPAAGFAAGALVAIASLVRLNLGLCAVALGLCGVLMARGGGLRERITWASSYVLGGAAPVVMLVILYAQTGELRTLVDAMLLPSLAYAAGNLSPAEVGSAVGRGVVGRLLEARHLAYLVTALTLLVAFGRLGRCWPRLDDRQRELVLLLAALIGAVALSILLGGQAHLHYLIQMLPFACPLVGILLAPALAPRPLAGRCGRGAAVAILLVASLPVLRAYGDLAGTWRAHGTPFVDPGYQTAAFLDDRLDADDRVFFLTHHIAGWLLGRPPIDRIAHPSNLARDEHVPVPAKLESILDTRPRYVVVTERRRFMEDPRIQAALDPVLAQRYREVARFGSVVIFELAEDGAPLSGTPSGRVSGARSPAP